MSNAELKLSNITNIATFNRFIQSCKTNKIDVYDTSVKEYIPSLRLVGFEISVDSKAVCAGLFAEPSASTVDVLIKFDLSYLLNNSSECLTEENKSDILIIKRKTKVKAYLISIATSDNYKGNKYADILLKHLAGKYKGYFVYSTCEADSYWCDTKNLDEVVEHLYVK